MLIYSSSFPCSGIILGINIFHFPPFLSKAGFHHCHFPKITDSHVVQLNVSNVPIIFFYIVCTTILPWKQCLQTEHPTSHLPSLVRVLYSFVAKLPVQRCISWSSLLLSFPTHTSSLCGSVCLVYNQYTLNFVCFKYLDPTSIFILKTNLFLGL